MAGLNMGHHFPDRCSHQKPLAFVIVGIIHRVLMVDGTEKGIGMG